MGTEVTRPEWESLRFCRDCRHLGPESRCLHEKAVGINLLNGKKYNAPATVMRYGRSDSAIANDGQPRCGRAGTLWEAK